MFPRVRNVALWWERGVPSQCLFFCNCAAVAVLNTFPLVDTDRRPLTNSLKKCTFSCTKNVSKSALTWPSHSLWKIQLVFRCSRMPPIPAGHHCISTSSASAFWTKNQSIMAWSGRGLKFTSVWTVFEPFFLGMTCPKGFSSDARAGPQKRTALLFIPIVFMPSGTSQILNMGHFPRPSNTSGFEFQKFRIWRRAFRKFGQRTNRLWLVAGLRSAFSDLIQTLMSCISAKW